MSNSDDIDDSLEQVLGSAISDQSVGAVAFTLTQDQITSFIAEKLSANPDIPIDSPQIVLDDGRADIYGRFDQNYLTANFRITMEPVVGPSGDVRLEISDTDFGPLLVPQALLDTISTAVNSFISDSFTYHGTQLKVDEIFIAEGFVTISGTIQQE